MPGEREARLAAIRREQGIPMPQSLVDEIRKMTDAAPGLIRSIADQVNIT